MLFVVVVVVIVVIVIIVVVVVVVDLLLYKNNMYAYTLHMYRDVYLHVLMFTCMIFYTVNSR